MFLPLRHIQTQRTVKCETSKITNSCSLQMRNLRSREWIELAYAKEQISMRAGFTAQGFWFPNPHHHCLPASIWLMASGSYPSPGNLHLYSPRNLRPERQKEWIFLANPSMHCKSLSSFWCVAYNPLLQLADIWHLSMVIEVVLEEQFSLGRELMTVRQQICQERRF